VPEWQLTKVKLGQALSPLGKAIAPGMLEHAKQSGLPIPPDVADAKGHPTGEQLAEAAFAVAAHYFPQLAEAAESSEPRG
jgi:LDH2 family malate/lactate/ureidoglycolate dehydrogenase